MVYNDVIEKIGMTIDAAGVAVIVAGAAFSFVACAVRLSRRERDVYRRLRQHLGQTILLGLELLVAGDIVRTVAASPDLMGVAILASIVGIRTLVVERVKRGTIPVGNLSVSIIGGIQPERFSKAVYGAQAKDASHGSLMMIVKGAQGMITKRRLPYVIKKERNDAGEITLGLHPAAKR